MSIVEPSAIRAAVVQGQLPSEGEDWCEFAASWSRLRPDEYMADGGHYRLRRYSEFDVDGSDGRILCRQHTPYIQSKEINHLNGGIARHYEPIEDRVISSTSFRTAIMAGVGVAARATSASRWLVQCFQNRITASSGEVGRPAPEGAHHDGVDFVLTLLVARSHITGGESQVFDLSGTVLTARELTIPGEYIVLDDRATMHGVTPVAASSTEDGYRDVLIAMYTAVEETA